MNTNSTIKVALVDDHALLRDALVTLINEFDSCKVLYTAANGMELIELLRTPPIPDVIILDLSMPIMDGYETAKKLQNDYPNIQVLMLTMYDSEIALIRLLQVGVKGFLKKDIHPSELNHAIHSVYQNGYYYSHNATGRLANLFRKTETDSIPIQRVLFNQSEIEFLKLACSELTYKEIAQKMQLNPRAVDNLRDNLFDKVDVRSRVGLAMYAIRHGIVTF